MSGLSTRDQRALRSAITRRDPSAISVAFEDEGERTYVHVERTDEITRYVLGPVERDANGAIVPGALTLLSPLGLSN